MKRLLLVLFTSAICYFTPYISFAQSQFQITFDYDLFDVVSSVKNTTGGYIAAGWTYGSKNIFYPFVGIAIETDFSGNVMWAKTYNSGSIGTPLNITDMQKTSAGGYIMTGARGSQALLMNLTSAGSNNWSRRIGNNNDWGNGVKQTAAGDFVVAGGTTLKSLNTNKDSTSIFIFKSSVAGAYQWGKTFTLTSPVFDSHDAAYDVVEVSGGYVFTGYHSQLNGADTTTNILLFKTDASGTLQWMKSYGALADNESGQKVIQLAGGDLLVAGWSDKTGLGDVCLLHTDASGNLISSSGYNVGTFIAPEVNSLVATSDGGYALFGWCATAAAPLFAYKPFLLKLNSSFVIQFTKHYNSQIGGFFVKGEEATNGGYIIGNMVGSSSWDLNLIKTNSNGSSGCNENNYTSVPRTYTPPVAAITPTVTTVGSSSNFTPGVATIAPTPTVVCATTALASSATNVTICNGSGASIGGVPTASGGSSPYTYSWTTGTGLSCTNCANPTASPTTTTTYTVTVTDANANSSTSTATVFVNPSPTASAGTATSICPGIGTAIGGAPTASGGTGPYTYSWSPSSSLSVSNVANPTASPTVATTYTVTVTDSKGCTSTSAVAVNMNPTPSASISGNTTICSGQTATLTASGGGTYLWNTGSTSAVINPNPTTTTSYSVTVTNGLGCTNTANVSVNVNSIPTAAISGSTTICAGNSATLTASGGGTYLWNTGSTNATITDTPTSNTTYTVVVSNGNCSSTATASVTVNQLPNAAIAGSTNICQGDIASLTASGGGTYLWNTGSTSATITDTPTSATSYTVLVTNGSGCTNTATTTVNVLPPPVASVAGNNTICSGQSTTLSASGGGNYSWNTGASTSSVNISPTTNTTYSVIVSAGSCADTASISVTVNASPSANITTASTSLCSGQSATLTATGGGTYSWNTGATTNPIIISPTSATSYSVVVSNGLCADSSSVNITVNTPPIAVASASASMICSGQTATLTASGGATYVWNPGGQTTSSITANPASSTNYTVVVSNGNCSDTANASITVNTSPTANISGNVNLCAGQTATLTATGGGTYLWNTSATTNSISVSPATNTSYTVIVTNANGCTASAIANVVVTPVPNVSIAASGSTICAGDATTLTASGGTTYIWNPGGQTNSVIVVFPSASTTYTVTAANGNCTSAASAFVVVNPSPLAGAGADVTLNYGSTTTINASGGGTYSWSTGELSQTISVSPTVTTVYCVTVTDANGCTDDTCVKVTVDYKCGDLFIPNAFSPNGDSKNDFFVPRNICFKTFHLFIYDRWGVKVFETEDVSTKGWDGMYKGKIGETAVFNYYFSYELVDGNAGVKKGTLSLIR